MRTYLILKDKARRVRADKEIQAIVAELRDPQGESPLPAYSRAAADALKARSFDRAALASRRLPYERLDQLVVEVLMGVR
jgi:xylose isomerase